MTSESSQLELLKRYLLGELSDAEQTRLEEQYFDDTDLYQELRAVRDDLIDAYVRGELSETERDQFERFFRASPRRRERIEFAEALLRTVESRQAAESEVDEAPQTSRWQFLVELLTSYRQPIFAAAVVVLLIAVSWLVVRTIHERQRLESERAGFSTPASTTPEPSVMPSAARSPSQQSPSSTNRSPEPTPGPKPVIATLLLTSHLVRGSEETQKLVIPKDVTTVQLQLSLDGPSYPSYRAVIRTPEGAGIWSAKQLKSQVGKSGRVVVLSLPADLLNNADYLIRLSGVTAGNELSNAGSYYFRVEKR